MSGRSEYSKKKEFEVKALPMEEKKRLIREKKAYWFFPHHIVEQIIICMAIVMILVIVSTLFPAELGPKADPFNTPDHIKPEWYFLAAYHSLKLAQYFEFLGAWAPKILGILAQGAAVALLVLVPFLDFGGKERRPSKRPIAMAIGAAALITMLTLTLLGHYS